MGATPAKAREKERNASTSPTRLTRDGKVGEKTVFGRQCRPINLLFFLMLTFDLFGLIAALLFVVAYLPWAWRRRHAPARVFFYALVFLYTMALVKTTLFPIPLRAVGEPRVPNLTPFQTIHDLWQAGDMGDLWANVGGNLLLLMPCGFFLAWGMQKRLPFSALFGIAFLITLLIEFWQLLISYLIEFTYRTFDVDDLILNTVGLIAAYVLTSLLQRQLFPGHASGRR